MALCPISCDPIVLVNNPSLCDITVRKKTIARLGFYACNTTIPEPLVAEGIEDLIENGSIVWSNELANVTWEDPTFDETVVSDCRPNLRTVSGRNATFQDRIAVSALVGSPAIPNQYFDYAFWADKVEKSLKLNYLIMYCDGDVVVARDANGNPLNADLQMWLGSDAATTPGGAQTQFKSGSINFTGGDPLSLSTPPSFNYDFATGDVTIL